MIVALHGFTGTPASWDAVSLALPGDRLICPRLLGHGAPAEGVLDFDGEVDRIAAELPDAPVHLAGYSMGARLALSLAVRHRSKVQRLTLIGVHPGLEDEGAAAERRQADEGLARDLEVEGVAPFIDRWEALPLFASQRDLPEQVRRQHRARRCTHDARGLARALRVLGLGSMAPRGAGLDALPLPVELLVGERDDKFLRLARRICERRPSTLLTVVPGAGHDLTLEAPREVASRLRSPGTETRA